MLLASLLAPWGAEAQTARISEEVRTIPTYPFDEPNPVPILTRDARLYPYHSFDGYATEAEPRDWTVVRLENDWIEVFVLPEVGGKVWGAVVKETGHEFIYRNEVLKFRNIALRGPWTSGGIEFNFGVIGHTPATATPVDYRLVENEDGSVSCWVGGMDLPSRTHWRVEIRLPADRATFETRVFWSNPTPLEQPYYNWMTGAAFARADLELTVPGNAYLEHSGQVRPWPVDSLGRHLPSYAENTFGGHKSYHVVGELNDFFGGYYADDDYGFGHWARHEEMPGQKIWLWALSPEGGVWEDLLTDSDGQYVEFQAGRLLVQYSSGPEVNPITEVGFGPGSSSRWSETWFPLEGTGGLTDASAEGAIYVSRDGSDVRVAVNAFRVASDTLRVWSGDSLVAEVPVALRPLEQQDFTVDGAPDGPLRVRLAGLDIDYRSAPQERLLSRPFATDGGALPTIPDVDRTLIEARELMKGRRYEQARPLLDEVLASGPWNRGALLASAELAYRRARAEHGLGLVARALQLDTYDPEANFLAGVLHRRLGRTADARDAFGWAVRSMEFRSVGYVQLSEIMLASQRWDEAKRYARLALDYDRYSMSAWRALAVAGRLSGDAALVDEATGALMRLDPLGQAALAEMYLAQGTDEAALALEGALGGEYPEQTLLELAIGYVALGREADAALLLDLPTGLEGGAVLRAWRAWLADDASLLAGVGDIAFAFPYRTETLPVLTWADAVSDDWKWSYLRALNLWAVDRAEEAAELVQGLGETPDFAPVYAVRGHLTAALRGGDPTADLRRAVEADPATRALHVSLIRALQERGRWQDAASATTDARFRFPADFNLALLDARTLMEVGRAEEAADLIGGLEVLPSEGGRESHRLWESAHMFVALDALEQGDPERARGHLLLAMEWPESLGQGRPYEPEERMARYLLGVAEARLGRDLEARAAFEAVAAASGGADVEPGRRWSLLRAAALRRLGRSVDVGVPADSDPATFQGLEGRILERALALEDAPPPPPAHAPRPY